MTDSVAWFWERLQGYGERPCLLGEDGEFSYDALWCEVERCSAQLEAHTPAGAVVALRSDFSLGGVAALLALARLGRVAVPVVTRKAQEFEARVAAGCVTHVWDMPEAGGAGSGLEAVANPVPPHDLLRNLQERGRPGLILFSSGSSGEPKAMLHDFAELLQSYEGRRARSLRILAFLLFDHIGGLHTLFGALASGAALVLPGSREPEVVARAIARHGAAVLPASPSFLSLMLMSGALKNNDLSSLKIVSYGTEPMPESLLNRLREALPKARFIQTFGTSETGIAQTVSRSSSSLAMRIDDPGTEVKIVDGELWLRSKTQICGYLNADNARFTADGWFRTGDLVEEMGEGFLRIRGRATDIINVGGEKVFPSEVESVIMELPGVEDCLALAEPNMITGQAVSVQIVAAEGQEETALKREIRRHCRERLDAYKAPARIRFVARAAVGERFKRIRRPL